MQHTAGVADSPAPVRVVVADDVAAIRCGLTELLRPRRGIQVTGMARTAEQAVEMEGYTSAEIANHVHLSRKTADSYRSRLMRRLGRRHRTDLVRFALQTGLLIRA
jgi:DNA-binding NarL/FixJ family response regulator